MHGCTGFECSQWEIGGGWMMDLLGEARVQRTLALGIEAFGGRNQKQTGF